MKYARLAMFFGTFFSKTVFNLKNLKTIFLIFYKNKGVWYYCFIRIKVFGKLFLKIVFKNKKQKLIWISCF